MAWSHAATRRPEQSGRPSPSEATVSRVSNDPEREPQTPHAVALRRAPRLLARLSRRAHAALFADSTGPETRQRRTGHTPPHPDDAGLLSAQLRPGRVGRPVQ